MRSASCTTLLLPIPGSPLTTITEAGTSPPDETGRRQRRRTSSRNSCSPVRQTKPVTDSDGRSEGMETPETAAISSMPRKSAIAERSRPAESGRRLGCLRRYFITASAIGPGTSGFDLRQRLRLVVELRLHQGPHAGQPRLGEGIAAAQELVADQPEAIEVGAVVELVEVELLGGAIGDGTGEAGLGRERRLHAVELGQAEVHQLDLEAGRAVGPGRRADEDVGRLDVAVDDAVIVDVVEGQGQLAERVEHLFDALAGQAGDRPAMEELHGEEGAAAELSIVEDPEAVRDAARSRASGTRVRTGAGPSPRASPS